MGKRKRMSDQNKTPPPPDVMPYSSRMDSLSKEKSSHSADSSALKSLSSIMDIMDSSGKLPNTHNQHSNLSRTIFLRHPRHYYGRQYSRRNSANNADASSSRGKGILRDDKFCFKLANQCNSGSGCQTENKENAFCRPERIRTSSFTAGAGSTDAVKMVCGICEKSLKRKPHILGNAISSGDLSVAAVLFCGHVYHADCLEQRTSNEDRWDPPCPSCCADLNSGTLMHQEDNKIDFA